MTRILNPLLYECTTTTIMNQLFAACYIILNLLATTSSLPTAEVMSCNARDVSITLSGFNASVYRGMPYVKGYEHIKDCIRLFHYGPTQGLHTLQFRMDYTDVRFDAEGNSEYHPSTSICAKLKQMKSFRAGSFQTTVVLPRSTGVELDGDLAVDVDCAWDYDSSPSHNGTASVMENFIKREERDSVIDIHVITSSRQDASVIRLGDRLSLQVVGPDKSVVWDRAAILSLEAVSRSGYRHSRIELIRQGCVVRHADLAALNVSLMTPKGASPRVSLNAFRFLTDPLLQFDVTVRVCKSGTRESIKYCQFACNDHNKTPKPSYQHTVRPETDRSARTQEYEEISSSVYLLVPYSEIRGGNCENKAADVFLTSDVVLVLTSRDVTMVTVILFFILASLVVSASTVIAYRIILRRRKHFYSLDLWQAVGSRDHTPPGLDDTGLTSPVGTSPWIRNRLITPPPTFAHSLKFTNQISPVGTKAPSTIDGKHFM